MEKTVTTIESIPKVTGEYLKPTKILASKRKYIIHVGIAGFPIGFAAINRIKHTLEALSLSGFDTLAISKRNLQDRSHLKKAGRTAKVAYVNTSFFSTKQKSFIAKRIDQISGLIGELILLFKKKKRTHAFIYYGTSFIELCYYRLLSFFLGAKLFVQYVEYRSSFENRMGIHKRINDFFFDRYLPKFCDGIIAISEFLRSRVLSFDKQAKVFKLPAICDYNAFPELNSSPEYPYLMYCGSVFYHEVICFIIDVFKKLKDEHKYKGKLVLVCGSHHNSFSAIISRKITESQLGDDIILKEHISYDELYGLYKGAQVLFIPLRNSVQDIARFPHKVGEYTASGRPFISTRIGEISHYFEDGKNALLAEDYSVDSYYQKLSEVLDSPDILTEIGRNGYYTGRRSFHYATFSESLGRFIREH
ncbi:MAG: glycosyltransferase family 4 protein [Cyclobacteriaceae bacterium]